MSFRKPLPIIRTTGSGYVDGQYVRGQERPMTIRASVQPAQERDLLMLPEGRRNKASFRLYTNDVLVVSKEGDPSVTPDRAVINDEEYEVHALAHWNNGVLNHRKYIVVRVQPS